MKQNCVETYKNEMILSCEENCVLVIYNKYSCD